MSARPTLKDLARAAGLSLAATSYALRGSPKVSAETSARVRALAEKLGYRANSRVAELMAHIRSGRSPKSGDRIALVWTEGTRDETDAFRQKIIDGARARATARGYALEIFWLHELEDAPDRLSRIIQARGIAGVVFGPPQSGTRVNIRWAWEHFASAVIGMAEWERETLRAGHHHFEAMRMVLERLHALDVRAPACWLQAEDNARAHRGWQAAWLASGFAEAPARLRLALRQQSEKERRAWLRAMQADALVVSSAADLTALRAAGWKGAPEKTFLLNWEPGLNCAGVDQGYEHIAGRAIDLVVAQIQRNERGLPEVPQMLLFPGRLKLAKG